jgi:hypothetical protein
MAMRSKVCFSTHLIVSNPAEGMDVRLLCLLCVVSVPASTTGLSIVQKIPKGCVCLTVYGRETSTMKRPRPALGCCFKKKKKLYQYYYYTSRGRRAVFPSEQTE